MEMLNTLLHEGVALMTAIVTLASTITAVTDTPNDRGFLAKIYKVIEMLALVTDKTKQH